MYCFYTRQSPDVHNPKGRNPRPMSPPHRPGSRLGAVGVDGAWTPSPRRNLERRVQILGTCIFEGCRDTLVMRVREQTRDTNSLRFFFVFFSPAYHVCTGGFFPVPWLLLWPIPRGASTQSMHGADGLSKCVVSMRVANEKGIWAAELVGRARASVWAERETSRVRFSSAWKPDMNNLTLHALQA